MCRVNGVFAPPRQAPAAKSSQVSTTIAKKSTAIAKKRGNSGKKKTPSTQPAPKEAHADAPAQAPPGATAGIAATSPAPPAAADSAEPTSTRQSRAAAPEKAAAEPQPLPADSGDEVSSADLTCVLGVPLQQPITEDEDQRTGEEEAIPPGALHTTAQVDKLDEDFDLTDGLVDDYDPSNPQCAAGVL